MKIYELEWGTKFTVLNDNRVFTLLKGDGMYMWVEWTDNEERHTGQMHISTDVKTHRETTP